MVSRRVVTPRASARAHRAQGSGPRAAWALVAGLCACTEAVELGTECRPQLGCPKDGSTQGGRDGGGAIATDDASVDRDTGASEPLEGGADASAEFFDNGGLEASSTGNLVTGIVLAPDSPAAMASWQPCQLLSLSTGDDAGVPVPLETASNSVEPSATVNGQSVSPAEGRSFVAMGFPPFIPPSLAIVPLSQTLRTPLEAGRSYAFAAKVYRVDSQHDYTLRVYLSDAAPECLPPGLPAPTPAAEVPVPNVAAWSDVCLSFTPEVEARELMIAAAADYFAVPASKTIAFFIDAMHAVAACPP